MPRATPIEIAGHDKLDQPPPLALGTPPDGRPSYPQAIPRPRNRTLPRSEAQGMATPSVPAAPRPRPPTRESGSPPVAGVREREKRVGARSARIGGVWDDSLGDRDKGGKVAPIVESIEIARRPADVFAYVTDSSHLPEWQESVVSVRREGDVPGAAASRTVVTRRVGRREREMTVEITENPPTAWAVRGIDGPVRGMVQGTVEPLPDGERSRVTIVLDFEGHGIGHLLVPLVVRGQAQAELPKNLRNLKERLESGA